MSEFETMEGGNEYLKACFQGFAKSGKSWTAMLLALGTRECFKLTGPLAYLDTENAVGYLTPTIKERTGLAPVGKRSRNVDDAIKLLKWAENGGASVVVIDSVSHLWQNLCDGYLRDLNAARTRKGKGALARIPFSGWGPLKARWQEFMDTYLNSRVHVILCGRVSYDYDDVESEDGEHEIRKSGTKISAEKNTGYESSLLVEMTRVEVRDAKLNADRIVHRATVLGDRFNKIDAAQFDNPTFADFAPHVTLLQPDRHAPVETQAHPELGVDVRGETDWTRELTMRKILIEKIAGTFEIAGYSGTSAEAKRTRAALVLSAFGTLAMTEIENMESVKLQEGLDKLTVLIREREENK